MSNSNKPLGIVPHIKVYVRYHMLNIMLYVTCHIRHISYDSRKVSTIDRSDHKMSYQFVVSRVRFEEKNKLKDTYIHWAVVY